MSPFHANRYRILAAALAASAVPYPASGQELGRLFFTPEQRQMLDRQRQLNAEVHQEIQRPEDPVLTIDGVVTRSSGKKTVWINGIPQNENDTASGISATPHSRNPGTLILRVDKSAATSVRVGGSVNHSTGETGDVLGNGRIIPKTVPTP